MPIREQTINEAIRQFESATYPGQMDIENAWLGIYQTLLWYKPVDWLGFTALPHIIDADKLRPNSAAKRSTWKSPGIWQKRAQAVSQYIAPLLGCAEDNLPQKTDLLLKLPEYEGLQRQNI